MNSYRVQRVGKEVKRGLSEIFQQNREEFGGYLLTVTEVRLPRDLRSAKVWVSVYGQVDQRREAINLLCNRSGKIRSLLAGKINLRRMPEIKFLLDETLDTAERIDRLLNDSGIRENSETLKNGLNEEQSRTDP